MQHNIDALQATLQSLESRKTGLMTEIETLESKRRALSDGLRPLTIEVESLRGKQQKLTDQVQSLATQLRQSEERRRSEEASLEVLRKERLELERQVKPMVKKNGQHNRTSRKRKHAGVKQNAHTFIGKYEGKEDWNAELAKRISQLGLTLDHTTYSVSPEKIVFSVTGSNKNIERLATGLNGLEGFVNLRSKLAETRRTLREAVNTRNTRQEQLNALSKTPWYKRETSRGLSTRKATLSQQISADDLKIRALNEHLKALENLLGIGESATSVPR